MTQPIPGTTPRQWGPEQSAQLSQYQNQPENAHQNGDQVRIADFSYRPSPIRFTIDGETYDCKPTLPLSMFESVADLMDDGRGGFDENNVTRDNIREILGKFSKIFELVMTKESAARFNARMMDPDYPLDIKHQVMPIMSWILEQYGVRPTEHSSESSDGSEHVRTGTGSADGVRHDPSIPRS